ncbi:SGS-domain-containing protein [Metschnikowia bicuspidata]|uniref:SGS-domain-containing protein n=1 Tax=Metschnikowia bicuspidata TaxID=27322 RepID=A0A4P9ZEY1_9ASCO|nr:SGS-domain-containing protein [Metschnikowia bicuspidata]
MAIETTIKQGDDLAEALDFAGAIYKYTCALKENPDAFSAVIKRAQAYTKAKEYTNAKADIESALQLAEKRGKMHEKALCYFRRGIVFYAEKKYADSLASFKRAVELKCPEPSLNIWVSKVKRDLEKQGKSAKSTASTTAAQCIAQTTAQSTTTPQPSTSIETINKHTPLKLQIRDDWYQDQESVTVTIYAKNVYKDSAQTEFSETSVAVSFPTASNSEYQFSADPLYGQIVTDKSSCKVYSTKIELTLKKASPGKWASLRGSESTSNETSNVSYPSSSKKAVNWAKFQVKEDADETEDFFAKLYKNVDEDTKRAMMKSYVESNGTVLTTNWDEAKLKTFEISPPEGMEPKKW